MANVDPRRKTAGRRIQRTRERAGYGSQREFAMAIGISEASVANAERGGGRVGNKTYGAIEDALGWPEGCIRAYLESGDESLLGQEWVDAPAGVTPGNETQTKRPQGTIDYSAVFDIAEGLPREMQIEFVRQGFRQLPDVRARYGDAAHDEAALKLIKLAELTGQNVADLLSSDAS